MTNSRTVRDEIVAALESLGAKPSDFRELSSVAAAQVRAKIEGTFVNARASGWWWEHFRLPTAIARFDDQKAFTRICEVVAKPDEPVWFVAEESRLRCNPVFAATPRLIMDVIGECNGFEYYLVAKDYSWLLCETHHDAMIAIGDAMRPRLTAIGAPSVTDNPWCADFVPPPPLRTARIRLEVLGPDVVDLDYAAIMSSRARLRDELRWGKDRRWPPDDFTLNQNRVDLERHFAEYERREAYAYTVLDPTGDSCLGCIYIEPHDDGARLAFWVIDDEIDTDLEAHLLGAVFEWFSTAWSFGVVIVSLQPANGRGVAVVESLGLERLTEPADEGHVSYAWARQATIHR